MRMVRMGREKELKKEENEVGRRVENEWRLGGGRGGVENGWRMR